MNSENFRMERTGRFLLGSVIGLLAWFGADASFAQEIRRFGFDPNRGLSAAVLVPAVPEIYIGQLEPRSESGEPLSSAEVSAQIGSLFDRLEEILRRHGSDQDHLIHLHFCVRDQIVANKVWEFLSKTFEASSAPTVTLVAGDLPDSRISVALDAIAVPASSQTIASGTSVLPESGRMARILPPGRRAYISGQAEKGDFDSAVRNTMKSLFETLDFLHLSASDVIRLKGFVQPIGRAPDAYKILAEFFGDEETVPPVVWVEWSSSLPIEIEMVVSMAGSDEKPRGDGVEYLTPPGMKPSPVFSRVAVANHPQTLYISGLYGPPGESAEKQVRGIFQSLGQILNDAGSDFRHLVKATYYVSDSTTSSELNNLRPEYYQPDRPPAASKARVRGVGIEGCGIAVDMIAVPSKPGG